ncbi:MAG: Lrp/AsnC family transcriptional regulator [Granulosicoccus sp.]
MAFISIRLQKQTECTITKFEKGIKGLNEVMACYLISGTSDYRLQVLSGSLWDYERFVRDKLSRIPGIGTLETHFAYGQVKQQRVYPGL